MQLDIGSRVQTSDGHYAGKVKRIIFDSDRMIVRQFVMRAGVLLPNERIVDLALIDDISADHSVTINVPADEIDDLPAFVRAVNTPIFFNDIHHPTEMGVISRAGSVPADAVVLGHGSQVYDVNGEHMGHLDEIVYGERGIATEFVVDTSILFGRESVIPVSSIESITHGRIELKIRASEIERAPAA